MESPTKILNGTGSGSSRTGLDASAEKALNLRKKLKAPEMPPPIAASKGGVVGKKGKMTQMKTARQLVWECAGLMEKRSADFVESIWDGYGPVDRLIANNASTGMRQHGGAALGGFGGSIAGGLGGLAAGGGVGAGLGALLSAATRGRIDPTDAMTGLGGAGGAAGLLGGSIGLGMLGAHQGARSGFRAEHPILSRLGLNPYE